MDGDELVREYIGRLEAAAWPLAEDRRRELVGEVREHIDTALSEAGRRDDVTVHNVLERLGRPEEIVASEVEPLPSRPRWDGTGAPGPVATAPAWGVVEVAAVLLLTFGAILLPLVGPALGLGLVWVSTRWTTREKLIATTIVVVIFMLPVLGLLMAVPHAGA